MNHAEYTRQCTYDCGKASPFFENKKYTLYFGVHIAERYLAKIFEKVTRMPINHKGYDFVCGKGYKIDVKSSCINKNNIWNFNIGRNKIAEYFLLLAFDNRESLNPIYVWIFKGNNIVGMKKRGGMKKQLNDKGHFYIPNRPDAIRYYKKYEQTDKLEKLKKCCDTLKNKKD